MDITIVFGLHVFGKQATIGGQGPFMYSGHYTISINVCQRNYCNDSKNKAFEMNNTKTSSATYVVIYTLIK